jgi:SAM-dependent methyltransferase
MSLDDLLAEASSRPVLGWDFGWLGQRLSTRPPDWDFKSIVEEHSLHAANLLDMSTGGGEWLADLRRRPGQTIATEGWPPNVAIAHSRLAPLGVNVVWVDDARDNVDQRPSETRGKLPFRTDAFSLIVNRHASFVAAEVSRVLRAGGSFLTEQVGGDDRDVDSALGRERTPAASRWDLALATRQIGNVGLRTVAAREGTFVTDFADVGAFAWYLRAVPWTVADFTIDSYRPALARVHDRIMAEGPLSIRLPAFMIEATK